MKVFIAAFYDAFNGIAFAIGAIVLAIGAIACVGSAVVAVIYAITDWRAGRAARKTGR